MHAVTIQLSGGLGNRMFQEAAAMGYAVKHGRIYRPWHDLKPEEGKRRYRLREPHFTYTDLPDIFHADLVILEGYFQSEKYFSHIASTIEYVFQDRLIKAARNREVVEQSPYTAAMHIRRGDYLLYPRIHPPLSTDWYMQAMYTVNKKTGIKEFHIYTDQPETIGAINIAPNFELKVMPKMSEAYDMASMMCYPVNIIANSTFSWWAAWLNQNPNKLVISPSVNKWFGPDAPYDATDIIPENWIQLDY